MESQERIKMKEQLQEAHEGNERQDANGEDEEAKLYLMVDTTSKDKDNQEEKSICSKTSGQRKGDGLPSENNLGEFHPKFDKGAFIGYSTASKTMSKESLLDDEPKIDEIETSTRNWQMKTYHHEQQILRNIEDTIKTQSTFKDQAQMALLSEVEPKNVEEALLDD
ncbi:hypothetical protein CR513_23061, partial [Mucuna pruriens]